jgi:hypothetical protein
MFRVALVLSTVLLGPAQGAAQEQNTGELIERRDVPAAVSKLVTCGTDPDLVSRHAFAGGYLFAWDCARNPANLLQALVFAERYDGTGARLLRFSQPRGEPKTRRGQDAVTEISNKRLFPLTGEIVEIYIDPVEGGLCRFEGRWKLVGAARMPMLVSFRQTRDCRGRDGWVGVVPADATGTTRERPRR